LLLGTDHDIGKEAVKGPTSHISPISKKILVSLDLHGEVFLPHEIAVSAAAAPA
jgi:hypothetical protein